MSYNAPVNKLLLSAAAALETGFLDSTGQRLLQGVFVTPVEYTPKCRAPYALLNCGQLQDEAGQWSSVLFIVLYFNYVASEADLLAQNELVWQCMEFLRRRLVQGRLAPGVHSGTVMQADGGHILAPGRDGEKPVPVATFTTIEVQPEWLED